MQPNNNTKDYGLDKEHCAGDKRITENLSPGETILLSARVYKFNQVNKQQKRIILITNKNLYNITPSNAFTNIFAKMISSLRIKRKIPLSMIHGVTVSRFG